MAGQSQLGIPLQGALDRGTAQLRCSFLHWRLTPSRRPKDVWLEIIINESMRSYLVVRVPQESVGSEPDILVVELVGIDVEHSQVLPDLWTR